MIEEYPINVYQSQYDEDIQVAPQRGPQNNKKKQFNRLYLEDLGMQQPIDQSLQMGSQQDPLADPLLRKASNSPTNRKGKQNKIITPYPAYQNYFSENNRIQPRQSSIDSGQLDQLFSCFEFIYQLLGDNNRISKIYEDSNPLQSCRNTFLDLIQEIQDEQQANRCRQKTNSLFQLLQPRVQRKI